MPRLCCVCTHPKRRAIDEALIEHTVSYETIARRFGWVRSGLLRHEANHVRAALQQSQEAGRLLDAERLAELDEDVDRVLERAGRDHRLALLTVTPIEHSAPQN